jgi:TolB protein
VGAKPNICNVCATVSTLEGLLNQRHITALLASLIAMTIGPLKIDAWLNAVKRGQTFATNGPPLSLKLNGKEVGDTLGLPAANSEVKITAWLRSFVPIDHLELICDGKVARELKLNSDGQSADIEDMIFGFQSGWCLLRASSDKATYPLLDLYPYATTSPIYIAFADSSPIQKEDAAYFEASIDRMIAAAKAFPDWNNAEEKSAVLQQLTEARAPALEARIQQWTLKRTPADGATQWSTRRLGSERAPSQ